MSLIEFLDRTGKHVSVATLEKHKNEKHSYSEWSALIMLKE